MTCEHPDFRADVEVNRINDGRSEVAHFIADVRVRCVTCGGRFGFRGLPLGASIIDPMVSFDREEARLPLLSPAELELERSTL